MANSTTRMITLKSAIPEWVPILLGMLVMYVPTFYELFSGLWLTEDQAHGPVILALSVWLIHRQWPLMAGKRADLPAFVAGWAVFVIALAIYILGRSQQIMLFELSSFILILAAILLIKRGSSAVQAYAVASRHQSSVQ